MKTYKYKSKYYGFQMSIPDDWSGSFMIDLMDHLSHPGSYWGDASGKRTDSRTLVGPTGKYLNMLITPLLENEPEPTIDDTDEFFDGWAYRHDLIDIERGTINVANKEHFWATYHQGLFSLIPGRQVQFFKKYCIYLNRAEYLFTARLYCVNVGEKLPTSQDLGDSEMIFDEMVSSIKLLNA